MNTFEKSNQATHPQNHQPVIAVPRTGPARNCIFVAGIFYSEDDDAEQLVALDIEIVSWSSRRT